LFDFQSGKFFNYDGREYPLVAIALVAPRAEASDVKINADVRASLDQSFRQTPGARELANNAAGVLVFPTVTGFGIGGGYGEGALLVGGRAVIACSEKASRLSTIFGPETKTTPKKTMPCGMAAAHLPILWALAMTPTKPCEPIAFCRDKDPRG